MELINWIWFAGAIASAATLGIADGKARNIQPIEALWLALLWVTAARKSDLPVVAGDQWQSFDVSVVPTSQHRRGRPARPRQHALLRPARQFSRHVDDDRQRSDMVLWTGRTADGLNRCPGQAAPQRHTVGAFSMNVAKILGARLRDLRTRHTDLTIAQFAATDWALIRKSSPPGPR